MSRVGRDFSEYEHHLVRCEEAAGDMYDALKLAEEAIENCHNYRSHNHWETLVKVKAALAMAEGRS